MIIRRSFVLLLLCATGCSDPLAPPADPERARATLQTALDAWQNGKTVDSLRARAPVIYFNDSEWSSGMRLVKYQFKSEQANGLGWRCIVSLTLQVGAGTPRRQEASYVIDTDPVLVVVREP